MTVSPTSLARTPLARRTSAPTPVELVLESIWAPTAAALLPLEAHLNFGILPGDTLEIVVLLGFQAGDPLKGC